MSVSEWVARGPNAMRGGDAAVQFRRSIEMESFLVFSGVSR
jgi:hypothetical protein